MKNQDDRLDAWTSTVTTRMRQQAARLCALMASSDGSSSFVPPCLIVGVDIHNLDGAAELARLAYWSIEEYERWGDDVQRECWAEAEALLRTGWTP